MKLTMSAEVPVSDLEHSWRRGVGEYNVCEGSLLTEHDIIEFSIKAPYEQVDPHGIQVFPGFSDGIYGTDRLTSAFAEQGRTAFSFTYSRTENPHYEDDPEGHKVLCSKLALYCFRLLTQNNLPVDALGHSEGGANSTRAALENPEEYRSLLLVSSGGLIKDDNQNKILRRAVSSPRTFITKTIHSIAHPGFSWEMMRGATDYVTKNPLKAQREAARIASADIRHRIQVLRVCKDIPTGALQADRDELFPLKLVLRDTDQGQIFDVFQTIHGDHLIPQKHPRRVAYRALGIMKELVIIQESRDGQSDERLWTPQTAREIGEHVLQLPAAGY